jgi:uncharacterized repeat protein (TIGR03806 family)
LASRIFTALLAVFAAACAREPAAPVFHAEGYPETLSAWGLFDADGGSLALNARVLPYELVTPLFTDYALKLRTVTLPDGGVAKYNEHGAFEFPVGSIISKTFYYATEDGVAQQGEAPLVAAGALPLEGVRLIETRLLVRRTDGWVAIPYVWNEAQTDATLMRAGAAIPMRLQRTDGRVENFVYLTPDQNQCAGCHATNATTRALSPIGLAARHLNRPSPFGEGGQLQVLEAHGVLDRAPADAPANADWRDKAASLDARARAYLDINCSHCHSDVGPADTSGLDLRAGAAGPALGLCKSPVAAGAGSGGRLFDIAPGEPEQSIFPFRMRSIKPGEMMPELGRALAHEEGAQLIEEWISSLPGRCA